MNMKVSNRCSIHFRRLITSVGKATTARNQLVRGSAPTFFRATTLRNGTSGLSLVIGDSIHSALHFDWLLENISFRSDRLVV